MQSVSGKSGIIYQIRKLSVVERLNIVADIWDEIKESKELEIVSEEEKRILLNRLANYRMNPDSATDWESLKQDVYNQYG